VVIQVVVQQGLFMELAEMVVLHLQALGHMPVAVD
jgi:hypothetical protein